MRGEEHGIYGARGCGRQDDLADGFQEGGGGVGAGGGGGAGGEGWEASGGGVSAAGASDVFACGALFAVQGEGRGGRGVGGDLSVGAGSGWLEGYRGYGSVVAELEIKFVVEKVDFDLVSIHCTREGSADRSCKGLHGR